MLLIPNAFIGAVAAGLCRGLALADLLRLGTYAGASNCVADGARGGMPAFADLPAELRSLLDGAPPLVSKRKRD